MAFMGTIIAFLSHPLYNFMNRFHVTLLGKLAFLFSLPLSADPGETMPTRHNILFVLVDDLGWYDMGYNGSTFYETPEIDRLSKQWIQFNQCYTPSPMCSPTRVSILTGKNPARHGVTQWLSGRDTAYVRKGEKPRVYCPPPQTAGIQNSEITLGEAFQQAGYVTAFYGKWHMGKLKQTGGPKHHGYDEQLAVIEENRCSMFYPFGDPTYFPAAKKGDNFTDLLTDAAIKFISTDHQKPFYLHLCHFAMHAPIASKAEERKRFEQKSRLLSKIDRDRTLDDYSHKPQKLRQDDAEYAGELATLDSNIGRLINALKQAGKYENTIIVFTGDNGGRTSYFNSHPTSNHPLRTGKTFVFEGGIKTPLLIHWPGHLKPKIEIDTPVCSTDFYPTLLEMTGLAAKPRQHLDGQSLVPLIKGRTIERDSLYWHFPHYQGEGAYPSSAIRKGNYKLIRNYHHDDILLFDLAKDPEESNNLASAIPSKASSLNKSLSVYLEEIGAHIPNPINQSKTTRENTSR